MTLRGVISSEGARSLVIDVHRTAGDDALSAWRLANDVAHELDATINQGWGISGPVGSETNLSAKPPAARVVITLPAAEAQQRYDYTVSAAAVTDYHQRATIVHQLEDVLSQYLTNVDWLPALQWCLDGQFANRAPRFTTDPADYARALEAWRPREQARAELLEPFCAGHHPVKQHELFSEFNLELTPMERAITLVASSDSIHARAISHVLAEPTMPFDQTAAHWREVSGKLIETDWVAKAPLYKFDDPSWLPRVVRGGKAGLLPRSQMLP